MTTTFPDPQPNPTPSPDGMWSVRVWDEASPSRATIIMHDARSVIIGWLLGHSDCEVTLAATGYPPVRRAYWLLCCKPSGEVVWRHSLRPRLPPARPTPLLSARIDADALVVALALPVADGERVFEGRAGLDVPIPDALHLAASARHPLTPTPTRDPMTTTLRLLYSASFDRAEYLDGRGHWSPVHPIPPAHPDTPQEQRLCDKGGLHLRHGTRYRATSRLLSHIPPFRTSLLRTAPAPIALELGLRAPDYADDGYIYLSAASQSLYLPRDTTLLIAHHTISDIDAIEGACAALRRAGMAGDAEQFRWAAESSRTLAVRHLGALISVIVPASLALRPPPPPDQLDPARGLLDDLTAARKIMMGEGL